MNASCRPGQVRVLELTTTQGSGMTHESYTDQLLFRAVSQPHLGLSAGGREIIHHPASSLGDQSEKKKRKR